MVARITTGAVASSDDLGVPAAPPRAVPDDVRVFVRAGGLARPAPRSAAARIVGVIAAWAALGALGLAVDRWWSWVLVWVALALVLVGTNVIMHESVHHNLFRSRSLNHLTGAVAGTVLFFNGPAFRAYHLTHHAYTFTPQDSEKLPAKFESRLHYLGFALVLGPAFAVLLWAGAIGTLVGRPPSWAGTERMRRHVRRWGVIPLAVVALVIVVAMWRPEVLVRVWLVPALAASALVFPVFTLAEHYEGAGHDSLFANTRTVESGRLGRLVWWNNNFHTAHHLVPTVPPSRLPELDDRIAGRNALREKGFVRFHARVLRGLPWL